MALFRRRTAGEKADEAIAAFWAWWATHRESITRAINSGQVQQIVDGMSSNVAAIGGDLSWEFGPGSTSRHQLTVTAAGDPKLRRVARRWLRAAPAGDDVWSFHDARQPVGDAVGLELEVAGRSLGLADTVVGVTRAGSALDVIVHHPAFAQLDQNAQRQVAFLQLDSLLGEEAVELWLGGIETSAAPPPNARPLAELPSLLDALIADTMPDGRMGWVLLTGEGPRGPVSVRCLSRLVAVQAPDFDQHVAVRVPLGQADASVRDDWAALEDHLVGIVGPSGLLVAVETAGDEGTLHFYVDSGTPAADQLRAAVDGWTRGPVRVDSAADPGWAAVAPFRT